MSSMGEALRRRALGIPSTSEIAAEADRLLPHIRQQHRTNRNDATPPPPQPPSSRVVLTKRKSSYDVLADKVGIQRKEGFTNLFGIQTPNAEAEAMMRESPRPSRKRQREEEEEDDEEEEAAATVPPAPSRKLVHAIASQTSTPHAAAEVDVVFVPFGEAVETSERINAFYRRLAHRDAMVDEKRRCFMCEYGNKMFDNSPDYGCRPYARLMAFLKENYSYVSNRGIAINMKAYFDQSIFDPALIYKERHGLTDAQFPIPAMSVEMFEEHIEKHTLNPIVQIGETIRMASQIQEQVIDRLIVRGSQNIDVKAIDAWAKLAKLKHTLSMTPRDRMLFGSGAADTLELDASRMGHMGNMKRIDSLLVSKTSAAGGMRGADPSETTGDCYRSNFTVEGLADDQPLDVRPATDDEFLAAASRALDAPEEPPDAMDIDGDTRRT